MATDGLWAAELWGTAHGRAGGGPSNPAILQSSDVSTYKLMREFPANPPISRAEDGLMRHKNESRSDAHFSNLILLYPDAPCKTRLLGTALFWAPQPSWQLSSQSAAATPALSHQKHRTP